MKMFLFTKKQLNIFDEFFFAHHNELSVSLFIEFIPVCRKGKKKKYVLM
jgi:hypothetical protein